MATFAFSSNAHFFFANLSLFCLTDFFTFLQFAKKGGNLLPNATYGQMMQCSTWLLNRFFRKKLVQNWFVCLEMSTVLPQKYDVSVKFQDKTNKYLHLCLCDRCNLLSFGFVIYPHFFKKLSIFCQIFLSQYYAHGHGVHFYKWQNLHCFEHPFHNLYCLGSTILMKAVRTFNSFVIVSSTHIKRHNFP